MNNITMYRVNHKIFVTVYMLKIINSAILLSLELNRKFLAKFLT